MRIISQQDLQDIITMRERVARAEIELKRLKEKCALLEIGMISAIKEGVEFEGALMAIIETAYGPARVRWRDVALDLAEQAGFNRYFFEARQVMQAREHRKSKEIVIITTRQ